jgi:hypothetical protein
LGVNIFGGSKFVGGQQIWGVKILVVQHFWGVKKCFGSTFFMGQKNVGVNKNLWVKVFRGSTNLGVKIVVGQHFWGVNRGD